MENVDFEKFFYWAGIQGHRVLFGLVVGLALGASIWIVFG